MTALVSSSEATTATSFTLIALAAVALGGTRFGGGVGGLLGSFLGAVCIYEIQTFLAAIHIAATWNEVAYGTMFLVGVVVGAQMQRRAVTSWRFSSSTVPLRSKASRPG